MVFPNFHRPADWRDHLSSATTGMRIQQDVLQYFANDGRSKQETLQNDRGTNLRTW